MKIIVDKNDPEIMNLVSEFVVVKQLDSKQEVSRKLLSFLREKNIKIEDGSIFEEVCNLIEKKIFEDI